ASGLDRFVGRLVASHMDDTIELAAIERASDEAFVRDTEVYEAAEVRARHELGREPTVVELAAELGWPEERVAVVGAMLNEARARYDSEIVEYLDDIDEEEAPRPHSAAKIVTAPVEVVQTVAGTAADRSVPEALPQTVECVVDPIDRRPVEQVQLGRVG